MKLNFRLWLLLREHFDPAAYDDLFNKELDTVLPTLRNADDRKRLASMRGRGWTNYIAACLRNAGFREQGDLEERIHDVVVKLLVSPGGLFRGYDERRHGPLDLRFKRSVSNAVKNVVEKENNRRKFLRPVPLHTDFVPGGVRAEDLPARPEHDHDGRIIDGFRNFLQTRLGDLAVAIFNARLEGRQTKDLVGLAELNRPGRYIVKRMVQQIKIAAREYAQALGDTAFLRRVEGLLDTEAVTVARRMATTQRRRAGNP
jgi:hypothetical protein